MWAVGRSRWSKIYLVTVLLCMLDIFHDKNEKESSGNRVKEVYSPLGLGSLI
jgi:hypothetical protein